MKPAQKDSVRKDIRRRFFRKFLTTSLIILITTIVNLPILLFTVFNGSISNHPDEIKPSGEFCIDGIFFLPNHIKVVSPFPTGVYTKEKITIFNRYDVIARHVCFRPTELLSENKEFSIKFTYFDNLDFFLLQKGFKLSTTSYPQISQINFGDSINYDHVIEYEMDYSTDLLDFYVSSNSNEVMCNQTGIEIACNIDELSLTPGESYELDLIAKYEDEVLGEMVRKQVNILTTVKVDSSSIETEEIIQSLSIPEIFFNFNKEVKETVSITFKDENDQFMGFNHYFEENRLIVNPSDQFNQNTSYFITIDDVIGTDESHMDKPYILKFSLGDGPIVTGSNISNGFTASDNIILNFDKELNTDQNIKNYIIFNSGTDYSYSISGKSIILNPTNTLSYCRSYGISISPGIVSTTNFTSTHEYSYSLSTSCKRTYSVGTSVQGRPIYGYFYGYGSKKIIFYGSMHGSEYNTYSTMNRWITELDYNISSIPLDKTIIIIPTLNPDGIANATRFNANGVDLNRNFNTGTWTSGTYFLDDYYPEGGGSSPFSEPETRVIRNLMITHSPYLTISYHSAASYVIPSNTSLAISLGQTYANLSGYSYVQPGADGAFTYDITGTFSEWAEANGYNSLVVELATFYYDEFSLNKKAMWEMVNQ